MIFVEKTRVIVKRPVSASLARAFLHCAAVDSFHGYRSANSGEQFARR